MIIETSDIGVEKLKEQEQRGTGKTEVNESIFGFYRYNFQERCLERSERDRFEKSQEQTENHH